MGGASSRGVVFGPGAGVWSRGGSAPGGAWWRPPGTATAAAVRILLECILVTYCVKHWDCLFRIDQSLPSSVSLYQTKWTDQKGFSFRVSRQHDKF